MAEVTAKLTNYRQSPRKVRVVADLVRGKRIDVALNQLGFLAKRAGEPIYKLIKSAVANAENLSMDTKDLYVKSIRVDKGVVLHRSMPRARGRAFPINKRSSHVLVVLDTKAPKAKKVASKKTKTTPRETSGQTK